MGRRGNKRAPGRSSILEAQDFYDNDTKLTFSCCERGGMASVMGIDLNTSEVVNFSKAPGAYNEPEAADNGKTSPVFRALFLGQMPHAVQEDRERASGSSGIE